MTDQAFIDYCAAHCCTERALFARAHVIRIYHLAGVRIAGSRLPEWITVRPGIMNPLVAAARAKLARSVEE